MRVLLLLIALLLAAGAGAAPLATPGSFAELTEFRAASRLKPWRTLQASGYDRGGGFYDSGNFLREEPGRHYVMLETEGPGVIDRMWFTRKSVQDPYDLLLYLDNRLEPAVRIGMDELCAGTRAPFVAPFVGSVNLARYCYTPVGFRSYCKAVLVPTAPPEQYSYRDNSAGKKIPHVYYQLTYRKLPTGSAVIPFSEALNPTETTARENAAVRWHRCGEPIAPEGTREVQRKVEVAAGGAAALLQLNEGGTIEALRLRIEGEASTQLLRLEGYWDGAKEPAISAPVGTLFAAPDRKADVRGLWLGCRDGEYYCHLPMPFRRSAHLALRSTAAAPVTVTMTARVRQEALADDAYFYARSYDHQPPLPPTHYTVLNVTGSGHWVGLVMDHPGNMEGDDQFYVDGETTPSIHGTGTEDFFSFAWGFSHLAALPLHGITRHFGAAIPYRVHLPAGVPFRRSLRLVFEHGHANEHQGRYSGVALYYLAPNQRRAERHPLPGS